MAKIGTLVRPKPDTPLLRDLIERHGKLWVVAHVDPKYPLSLRCRSLLTEHHYIFLTRELDYEPA